MTVAVMAVIVVVYLQHINSCIHRVVHSGLAA